MGMFCVPFPYFISRVSMSDNIASYLTFLIQSFPHSSDDWHALNVPFFLPPPSLLVLFPLHNCTKKSPHGVPRCPCHSPVILVVFFAGLFTSFLLSPLLSFAFVSRFPFIFSLGTAAFFGLKIKKVNSFFCHFLLRVSYVSFRVSIV